MGVLYGASDVNDDLGDADTRVDQRYGDDDFGARHLVRDELGRLKAASLRRRTYRTLLYVAYEVDLLRGSLGEFLRRGQGGDSHVKHGDESDAAVATRQPPGRSLVLPL